MILLSLATIAVWFYYGQEMIVGHFLNIMWGNRNYKRILGAGSSTIAQVLYVTVRYFNFSITYFFVLFPFEYCFHFHIIYRSTKPNWTNKNIIVAAEL